MMYGWRFGDGGGIWMLLGLICLGVIVGAVVGLVTSRNRHVPPPQAAPWQPPYAGVPMMPASPAAPVAPPRANPHDILRERLARGEISIEEFERTKAALGPEPGQAQA